MSRIFSVRINLDEINAFLLRWRSPDSRADWLDGFLVGCSGVDMDGTEPFTQANKLGLVYHGHAVAFQNNQADKANKRWHATAMPRHESGNATAVPTHMPEGMPEACLSNNRVIEESKEPVNQESIKRCRFAPPTLIDVSEYCKSRKNNVDPQRFIDHYESNGWRVGKNPMKSWQAAVRTWEKNCDLKPSGADSQVEYEFPIQTVDEVRAILRDINPSMKAVFND